MTAAKKKLDTNQVASELEESQFFQPTSTQTHKPTSTQVGKPTTPQVVKYTTHLQPSTIKAIKKFAFDSDIKDYQVVEAASSEFLDWRKDHDLVIWVTLFAAQSHKLVSDVIVQALKEFHENHKYEVDKQ